MCVCVCARVGVCVCVCLSVCLSVATPLFQGPPVLDAMAMGGLDDAQDSSLVVPCWSVHILKS